jgi:hypothetical protein
MSSQCPALLLASIHDVSPRFESEVDRLLDLLAPHVGERLAMLVVPNHWGDAPIVPGSRFATRLRAWADSEGSRYSSTASSIATRSTRRRAIGFRARFMTAGEGEFLGLDRAEAAMRINAGRALIEDVIGRPIDGFVAPAWLYGTGALEALARLRDADRRRPLRVWSPATGAARPRPGDHLGEPDPLRLASSLAAAAAPRPMPLKVLRSAFTRRTPGIPRSSAASSGHLTATIMTARRALRGSAHRPACQNFQDKGPLGLRRTASVRRVDIGEAKTYRVGSDA